MKLREISIALSTLIFAAGCASVSPPDGGPKDETPPTLISSSPKDQSINVSTKTVTLTFDEEIQQNNLNKELIITPDTRNTYKIRTDKNQISLLFENDFKENTTYNLNFREGIVDITEKNKASNLQLSFSTGSYIDSSKVSGLVVNLLTQKPEPKAMVLLYPADDTLKVRKHKPYYQAQTDASGNFNLKNIKEGEYKVYALVDKNGNSYYDTEEERVAYLPKQIKITPSTNDLKLELVKLDTKKPILLKRETYQDRFVANYNEGIKRIKARPILSERDSLAYKIDASGKAAELFKTDKFSGGKTIITAVDSSGNIASDTIDIKFEGKKIQRIKGATLKVINTAKDTKYYPGSPVKLELETPVRISGKEPLSIRVDSATVRKLKYPEDIKLDETATELSFNLPKVTNGANQVQILLDSTMILSRGGEKIKFDNIAVTLETTGGTGSVVGKVSSNYTSYTIQLLNPEFKIISEEKNKKSFSFKNLTPGNYQLRVLIDENKNNKWDGADPNMDKVPEKVYLYNKPIEVRANWDIEDINLEF